MDQLQFPVFPEWEARYVQPVLCTPPRQVWTLTIRERNDQPDAVCCTLEARDGDGELLVLINGFASRDEAYQGALAWLRLRVDDAWYETHSPF